MAWDKFKGIRTSPPEAPDDKFFATYPEFVRTGWTQDQLNKGTLY